MKKIILLTLLTFSSLLSYSQLALEGFEGTVFPPNSPSSWAIFDNGVGGSPNIDWSTNANFYQGTKAAYMNRQNVGLGNTSRDYLATPQVNIPSNGQLKFFTRTFIAGDTGTFYQIRVKLASAGAQNDPTGYTTIQQWTETDLNTTFNVYEEKTVAFPAVYVNQQVYVAFVMENTQTGSGATGDRWLVDNVKIIVQCLNPTNQAATPFATTANLSWVNAGGATSFEIENMLATATPTGVATGTSLTNTYTQIGLLSTTAYKYYVRGVCPGGDFSGWTGPFNYTTTDAPPVCGGNYVDAGGTAAFYPNSSNSIVTICPDAANPTFKVTVTFTAFDTETNYDGILVYDGNTSGVNQIPSANGPGFAGLAALPGAYWGTTIPGPFTSTSVDGCLTFRFISDPSVNRPGWTANVTCAAPPSCQAPNQLVVTTTVNSATLTWGNPGIATTFEVFQQPCGTAPPTAATVGIPVTGNTYTFNTLSSSTCYDFYVRGFCIGNDVSAWAGPKSGTTLIAPPVCGGNFVDNGGNTLNYINNSDETVTICPVNVGDKVTVSFTSFNTDPFGDGIYVYDGATTASPQISSGNPAVAFGVLVDPGAFWGNTIPGPFISTSADGCLTFRFLSDGFFNLPGWTSNITCSPPPTCALPLNLVPTVINSTSISIAWLQPQNPNGTTATSWQYIALPCGSPTPTATSVWLPTSLNPTTVNGLTSDTCYDFYVQAICSATDLSPIAGPKPATTLITPPACGGIYTDLGGVLNNYPDSTNSTVIICPTIVGEQVTVTFTAFNTETNWDGILVYDGNSILAPQISSTNGTGNGFFNTVPGAYWGTTIPGPFTSSSADGCLTFRFVSDFSLNRPGWEANVTCGPPPTCRKPNLLTATSVTQTSAVFGWSQLPNPDGSVATAWEILILPAGSPAPTATSTGFVASSTNPYTATSLTPATCFDYYVRAVCSPTDSSLWAGPKSFCTLIPNDECINAIVVPVNPDTNCAQTVSGSIVGATASSQANTCGGTPDDDVWFSFVATATAHSIDLLNSNVFFGLSHALYSGIDCNSLTPLYCSDFNTQSVASNLTIGQTYYIRVFSYGDTPQNITFSVCVGTIPPPITTASTIGGLTPEQIVQDVLLNSTCASVTNVTYSTSTNFGFTESGIGTFNQNGSSFPFSNGVILSTGFVGAGAGPNNTNQSNGGFGGGTWPGDDDLEAIILAATGDVMNSKNATKLEFDFIPITNNISFDFLFASEEYGTFQCFFSDSFAFLLTDITTGVTTNLAIVPNTTIPISVVTVRDNAYNAGCASANEAYFGQFNNLPSMSPLGSPTNFQGQTVPLTATAAVNINTPYHIKLVIADRSDTAYDSAVFLRGSSFGIGNLELGDNLLLANGTAVCPGFTQVINCGLDASVYTFSWLNNGILIPGETGPSLTVSQAGVYTVQATYINTTCSGSDSVTIEYYTPIAAATPNNLNICNGSGTAVFDLTQNTSVMLVPLGTGYTVTYFTNSVNANANLNPIVNPTAYTNTSNPQTICARIQNTASGCFQVLCFTIAVQDLTPQFTVPATLEVCTGSTGTISVTPINFNLNNVTYSWTLDGVALTSTSSSISVTQAGVYQVTVNNTGCTASQSTTVTIGSITADVLPNIASCDTYLLPVLSANNNYFTGQLGTGTAYFAGNSITSTQTLYIYAQVGSCTNQSSFTITINNTPIIPTIPNVTRCDSYALPALTIGNYYAGTGASGVILNSGYLVTATQTIYVYAQTATTPNCFSEKSFVVTIIPSPTLSVINDEIRCDSFALPNLPTGSTYHTATNGGGTTLANGALITSSQTIYVYAQTGTTPNCTDEENFDVTIIKTPDFVISGTCQGPSFTLEVTSLNGTNLSNVSYVWKDVSNNIIGTNPTVIVNSPGTYTCTITPSGPTSLCSKTVSFNANDTTCTIQKGISPNGDGDNETFDLSTLDVKQLNIYNRYGTKVYSFTNYTNQWGGQSNKGDILPDGTYYYVIEQGNGESKSGWIYINK